MFIERKILPELAEHLKMKQAMVITGIRRSGKTTLVNMLLDKVKSKNKAFIDLEVLSNRLLFDELNYDNILMNIKGLYDINFKERAYIAIDEIQYVKNIPSIVKYFYDHYNIKFILTGSSSYYIKNYFTESLFGRKTIFELYTLDFGEFLKFKNVRAGKDNFLKKRYFNVLYEQLKEYYREFIKFGGFPEVVLTENKKDKKLILKDILDSYVKKDIKTFIDFQEYSVVYKMMALLSSRVSNKLDYTKIANSAGVSKTMVASYVQLFEDTYYLKRINVIARNPDREIVKASKLYIQDNGLLNTLAEVSSGVQFENSVFNQLKHHGNLNYYSLKNGREIDFVLDKKHSFEVKEHSGEFDLRKLKALSSNIGVRDIRLIFLHPPSKNKPLLNYYLWGGDVR